MSSITQKHKSAAAHVLTRALVTCALLTFWGCAGPGKGTAEKPEGSNQIEQLKEHNAQLQVRLEQEYGEKEQLKKQIALLQGLPAEKKTEAIYNLKEVKIGKYTNIYEKDDEPNTAGKEKLIVYLQPIDETGDSIKAAGEVSVQLWDLKKKESEALVGQWMVKPAGLKKMWLNSAFSSSYRLVFDVSTIVKKAGTTGKSRYEMTVRITFTDYLSGRTFTDQKAIKPL
ncbi:MAG: hypothetical protein JW749_04235 [Sedimentisphaerales bacterium]|nr:hypothetical protein [Sedimentisphaerales bacterium]